MQPMSVLGQGGEVSHRYGGVVQIPWPWEGRREMAEQGGSSVAATPVSLSGSWVVCVAGGLLSPLYPNAPNLLRPYKGS